MKNNLIRFDWAMKRLLRDKSNYVVLEGFLSTLLGEDLHIVRFLESEANQTEVNDKFNRADMLVEDEQGRLLIIEVQNNHELDYFHRMLYGVSKTISEYINLGDDYDKVKKIYSINIVYFELGQGKDYVYHGKTIFRGLHDPNDVLQLSIRQRERFIGKDAGDIFPEYYVLRVNDFDKIAKTPLDEWIEFFKTGNIDSSATAKGLPEARERLRVDSLSDQDRRAYIHDMEALRYQRSVIKTGWYEGRAEGLKEGRAEGRAEGLAEGEAKGRAEAKAESEKEMALRMREMAKKMKEAGMPVETIAHFTQLALEEIEEL
ncbi:Rpn family recombination-promoting nuclease/putative transposase [Phocaeicola sp. Sa1CVN1]|uniref:Rpn family recombination-promoting nuclease/putative transposase n=1 Tax=Phocaeicola intestinalis TaxID=2762212 RepID=A0ABR8YC31_9BACT|nr:Rpn family recombination-promoting nuclease/putative transposase [Phocaeicola intestinalis]MBD8041775.1 Rpn family recombination-promoting nuclease/putative transposase [Phocaeicola intestinalis]